LALLWCICGRCWEAHSDRPCIGV